MFLRKPEEKELKEITLDEFEIELMNLIRKNLQPERSKREDIKCDECGFFKQNKEKDIRIPCACDDAVL